MFLLSNPEFSGSIVSFDECIAEFDSRCESFDVFQGETSQSVNQVILCITWWFYV